MTYKQAHSIIMNHLEVNGWTVKRSHNMRAMKVPHATNASGRKRLYFKGQAIHEALAPHLELKHARTLTYDTVSIKEWARAIQKQRMGARQP